MTDRSDVVTPRFAELPRLPGSDEHHAWDVWGRADEIGCLNRIGAEQVRAACASVTQGMVVSINLPVDQPRPGLFRSRTAPEHEITSTTRGFDDSLRFFPQYSSHWDGLRHVRYRQHGHWGGRQDDALGSESIGVGRWADKGIIGRGVLVDAVDYFARSGDRLDPDMHFAMTPEHLDAILADQGVILKQGDILMIRTGWLEWYQTLPDTDKVSVAGAIGRGEQPLSCPGLSADRSLAAYLWDHGIAAVAADNIAVEALPVSRETGFLHYRLIPLLGMALGELWSLQQLGQACRSLSRYDFLFTSGVLNIPGGVGSPVNGYAIF